MTQSQPQQLNLFQAKMLLIGLKFEGKTGMKMTSKVNSKKLAADLLGLPVRSKYPVLIEGMKEAIHATETANGLPLSEFTD